jgi:gliding motility-associated-like protein
VNFPNVFTPNGDGVNDVFVIPSAGLTDLDVKVYDRWGVEMAHMMAPGSAWDGTTPAGLPASNGTYYYTLHAKGEDGKAFDFTGFIMLIRTQ